MQKGYNSDLTFQGKSFHIQTEDWGPGNPQIITQVFSGGAVLKTLKLSYNEVLRTGPVIEGEAVRQALRRQHHRVMEALLAGQLDQIF